MSAPRHPNGSRSALEAAGLWYERLHRDKVSDAVRAEFEAWLAQSAEHREGYAQAERVADLLKRSAELPAVLALRHEAALRLTRRTRRPYRALMALAAALALVAIGVGTASLTGLKPTQYFTAWLTSLGSQPHRYATGTGERLAATLTDGSQVTLDTQSELEVAFTPAERIVRLVRGQAYFEVAKDKQHPFVVEVDQRRLVAVGTAFDVRMDAHLVQVTMVEGTVRVEPLVSPVAAAEASGAPRGVSRAESLPPPRTLISAGDQLLISDGTGDHIRPGDADRATAWRRGQLVFDGLRLGDAVAEMNRYSDTRIVLQDPQLADIRVSGAFAAGRPEVFVEALTNYFPIAVASQTADSVVLKASRP
ncbi:MAG: FecR domain-containing protein [Proteobacteria bacterium]|nr:FecR domain-containing protein [Pseudomonadota bacterium]